MARTFTREQQLQTVAPGEDLRTLAEGLADEHPEVREQCAQKLAGRKDPEAAPFLRHALDDDEPQVRVWGAYGLGLLARPEDRDELAKAQNDEAPLVRVWASFGLANLGDAQAVKALVAFLDLPDLELKSNAADALLSLADASHSRPLLERRLALPDARKRTWTAALLHRLGHKEAFGIWRSALVEPDTRVDAAMAAIHLRAPAAARELVRVAAELTQEELEAPVPQASDLPLAEVLTSPLLELDLPALVQSARKDAALRSDLLLLMLRVPSIDPEVLGTLNEQLAAMDPGELGRGVAELLGEQSPRERPQLLSRVLDFAPEAVTPALEAMEGPVRDALFDAIADAAQAPDEENVALSPLLSHLRQTHFAAQFADLSENPWGDEPETDTGIPTVEDPEAELDEAALAELDALAEEDDLALVVERMAAGDEVTAEQRRAAEGMLKELGLTAEEFVASLQDGDEGFEPEPPEPGQVALRALALGALQERARIEEEHRDQKLTPGAAKQQLKALLAWVEQENVQDILTPLEQDLLNADPGDWLDEDMELVDASTEALAVLLWALGAAALPPADDRVDPAAVMARVPLRASAQAFVEGAALKAPDEVEPVRDLYETFLWRAEQEAQARLALSGEEIETDLDLEALREDLAKDGFDAQKARARGGEKGELAEALRFLGRKAAQKLSDEGRLTLVKGDFGFEGKPLSAVSDEDLALAASLAQERQHAAGWVLTGGDWDELPIDDEFGGEIDESEEG